MKPAPRPLSPELLRALGNFLYVLTRVDGQLQAAEVQEARGWLVNEFYGTDALHAFLWRPNPDEPLRDAYAMGLRYLAGQYQELDTPTRQWLVEVLQSVAAAHEGICSAEARVLEQLGHDLDRLTAPWQVPDLTTLTFA